jgi:uncharacterized protein YcbK (DUF882 family)
MFRIVPPGKSEESRIVQTGDRLALPTAVALMVAFSVAGAIAAEADERSLSFRHTHTGEELSVVYWADGDYVPAALDRINKFLRDFRTDEVTQIEPETLDILHDLYIATGSEGVYEVISGYRSPRTNKNLREQGRDVARRSLHMQGRAIDVRLTDVDTVKLRDLALEMKRGGVGYYKTSDFVHIDNGRVRRW